MARSRGSNTAVGSRLHLTFILLPSTLALSSDRFSLVGKVAAILSFFRLQFQVQGEREDSSLPTVPAKVSMHLLSSEWII